MAQQQRNVLFVTDRWLTRLEAAAYLKIHPITLDRWVKTGVVIRHQIRGTQRTRYSSRELDNLLIPLGADDKMQTRGAAARAAQTATARNRG